MTYDASCGYIGSVPGLKTPVVALSLGGLRRKVAALLVPDAPIIMLQLDGLAERERHRRQGAGTAGPLRTDCLTASRPS